MFFWMCFWCLTYFPFVLLNLCCLLCAFATNKLHFWTWSAFDLLGPPRWAGESRTSGGNPLKHKKKMSCIFLLPVRRQCCRAFSSSTTQYSTRGMGTRLPNELCFWTLSYPKRTSFSGSVPSFLSSFILSLSPPFLSPIHPPLFFVRSVREVVWPALKKSERTRMEWLLEKRKKKRNKNEKRVLVVQPGVCAVN